MIKFYGKIAYDIQRRIHRKERFWVRILLLGAVPVVTAITIGYVISFVNNPFGAGDLYGIIGLPCLTIFLVVFLIYQLVTPWYKDFRATGVIVNVEIDLENIKSNRPDILIAVAETKRIIDYGDCYHIRYKRFKAPIICQKNLLKEGSLEDFERIFSDKIVRKSLTAANE